MNRPEDRQPPRVLLVEDETLIALDLEQWFTELGFEVVGPFRRADDAVRALDGQPVDLAVLDYVLDDGHCGGVADRLAAQRVPYVFLTGSRTPQRRAGDAGVPCLEKPVSRGEMTAVLRDLCAPLFPCEQRA